MFLKTFEISMNRETVYSVKFQKGLNLILDENSKSFFGISILHLIDYALGKSSNDNVNLLIEENLSNKNVNIELTLSEDLEDYFSNKIRIEIIFSEEKEFVRRINGLTYNEEGFNNKLKELIFIGLNSDEIKFKDIVSHNFRYTGETMESALSNLNQLQFDEKKQSLFYYLLGFDYNYDKKRDSIIFELEEIQFEKDKIIEKIEKGDFIIDVNSFEYLIYAMENNLIHNLDINIVCKILDSRGLVESIIKKQEIELAKYYEYKKINDKINDLISNGFPPQIMKVLDAEYNLALNEGLRKAMPYKEFVYNHMEQKIRLWRNQTDNLSEKAINDKIEFHEMEIDFCTENEEFLESKLKSYFKDLAMKDVKNRESDEYFETSPYYFIRQHFEEVGIRSRVLDIHLKDLENAIDTSNIDKKMYFHVQDFNMGFSRLAQRINYTWLGVSLNKSMKNNTKPYYNLSTYIKNRDEVFEQRQLFCFEMYYMQYADEGDLPCLHFLLSEDENLIYDNNLVEESKYVNEERNVQLILSARRENLAKEVLTDENIIADLYLESESSAKDIGEIS